MNNKNYEVYAVRIHWGQMIGAKTTLPDIISLEHMKSLIKVEGYEFYIITKQNTKIAFKFKKGVLIAPTIQVLKKIEQF